MESNKTHNVESIIVSLVAISFALFLLLGFIKELRNPVVRFTLYHYGEEISGNFINFLDEIPTGYIFNFNGNTYTNTSYLKDFNYDIEDYPSIEFGESITTNIMVLPTNPHINSLFRDIEYPSNPIKDFIIYYILLIFGTQFVSLELINLVKSVFNLTHQKKKHYIWTTIFEMSLAGIFIYITLKSNSSTEEVLFILFLSIYFFLFRKIENYYLVLTIYTISFLTAFFIFYDQPFIIIFSYFIAFKIIIETTITNLNVKTVTPLIYSPFINKEFKKV